MRRLLLAVLILLAAPSFAAEPSKCFTTPRAASDYVNVRILAANTAESTTAPTITSSRNLGRRVTAVITYTGTDFYYSTSTTAAIPGTDTTDGSAPGHWMASSGPLILTVGGGATLSLISADTTPKVVVEWYVACQ